VKIDFQDLRLKRIFHYHQRAGSHPQPIQIAPFQEFVELVTGGRGWVQEGETWREVTPGHLIWNKPGDWTIGRSDFAHPYRCLAIQLRTTRKNGLGVARFSSCADAAAVASFTDEVLKLFLDEAVDRAVLCQYIVGRLLLWVHRHALGKGRTELPPGLQNALQWMEDRYGQPCSVAQMARAAGWSSAYLHHMFRRHLAVAPHQTLRQRRLRAAREQLVATSHPVKRIAVECGFADASALIHAFRADLGSTPKSYRLQHAGMAAGVRPA
jgi:AraC-like DNA-binding protein